MDSTIRFVILAAKAREVKGVKGRRMGLSLARAIMALTVSLMPLHALAREHQSGATFNTEHTFGFSEGSDIGDKGESEIEGATVGRVGASQRV